MNARLWAGLPVAFVFASCQTYSPEPVDLAEHLRRFADRSPDARQVQEFARDRAASGPLDFSKGIDLSTARLVALVFNPGLRTARLHAGVAAASAAEAGRWSDPEVDASFLRILESGVQYPWLASAGVGLTLPLTGRPALEKELAEGRSARALTEARVAEVAVLDGIDAAWVGWSAAGQTVALLEDLVTSLEQLEATAGRLAARQAITQIEMRTFTLARVSRAAELAQARSDATLRDLELKRLLGLPPERPLAFVPTLQLTSRVAIQDRRQRLTDGPIVTLAKRDYEVAERKLRLAIRKQWPELTLQPRWEEEDAQPRVGLGFSLPLPLWNANAREISESRAERAASAEQLRATIENAAQDLARAEARAKAAAAQRQLVETDLLPLAQQQIADVRRLIELGQLDTLLLLDAMTRTFDARVAAIRAASAEADATIALNSLFWPELSLHRKEE